MRLSEIRRHSRAQCGGGRRRKKTARSDKPEENLDNNNAHFRTPTTHYQSLLIDEGRFWGGNRNGTNELLALLAHTICTVWQSPGLDNKSTVVWYETFLQNLNKKRANICQNYIYSNNCRLCSRRGRTSRHCHHPGGREVWWCDAIQITLYLLIWTEMIEQLVTVKTMGPLSTVFGSILKTDDCIIYFWLTERFIVK